MFGLIYAFLLFQMEQRTLETGVLIGVALI